MAGSFICKPPFNTFINPALRYECVAVDKLRGMIAMGENPLDDIYIKYSLGVGLYQFDIDNDDYILTLQAATGDIFKIPNSHILSLPDPNGVRYDLIMLGISLSAIPNGTDLSILKNEIQDLVFNTLGVRSQIQEIQYGAPTLIGQDEHRSVEAARQTNISRNNSNLRKVRELTLLNERLSAKLGILEKYIQDNYVKT